MSFPTSGGIPQVLSVTVSAGTPLPVNFTGRTNYLMVTASGACTMAFNNKDAGVKLAAPSNGNTVSWQGPAKTSGVLLNSTSGNVTVEIVAFLVG